MVLSVWFVGRVFDQWVCGAAGLHAPSLFCYAMPRSGLLTFCTSNDHCHTYLLLTRNVDTPGKELDVSSKHRVSATRLRAASRASIEAADEVVVSWFDGQQISACQEDRIMLKVCARGLAMPSLEHDTDHVV